MKDGNKQNTIKQHEIKNNTEQPINNQTNETKQEETKTIRKTDHKQMKTQPNQG